MSQVDHPDHYQPTEGGVECIDVVEGMNFCVGNAIKYLWRAGRKGSKVEDLQKARWYIQRRLARHSDPLHDMRLDLVSDNHELYCLSPKWRGFSFSESLPNASSSALNAMANLFSYEAGNRTRPHHLRLALDSINLEISELLTMEQDQNTTGTHREF